MIGETIGHYRLQAELGSGGMGVVYRAEDLKLGRDVALKFLGTTYAGDPAIRERFLREARAAATLNHPHVCTIYEINDGDRPFIAMELLEGQTLQRELAAGPIPLQRLLDLAIQVADGLDAAHARGLVHRDIKPANIFVTADDRAKVVDFGLAKIAARPEAGGQSLVETSDTALKTSPGTALGTVAYMSPEQARGETLDARSDLFSFGLVLYEMATGSRAFDGATAAVVFDGILNRTPLPPAFVNPAVPVALERIIACAIEKSPGARYQRAADLAADLRTVRRSTDPAIAAVPADFVLAAGGTAWGAAPGSGGQRTARERPAKTARGRLVPVALFAVAVLVGAAGALAWWLGHPHMMTAGTPVLVTDFVNRTGDVDFDGTLKQALTIKLEESPYVSVVSQQKVRETLARMARQPDEAVTPALAREMCQRLGGGALTTGEISRLGSAYVLTLGAESCAGDEISREQVQASRKEDVLAALGTALSSMRGRLGESLASIRAHDRPLVDVTTSSLPALKSFALGDQRRADGIDLEAIPYYREAVALDPQFALAWARLGTVYGNTGEAELSKQCYQKAYDLRDRASERERFYITAHYVQTVAGDLARTHEVYERWRQQYPHDTIPVQNLGVFYEETGDPERALQAFRDASAMEPHSRLAREAIFEILFAFGRFAEARRVAEQEIADLGDSPRPHLALYELDYLSGDGAGMAEHARRVSGGPLDLDRQAKDFQFAMFEGRFGAARTMLTAITQQAESQGRAEFARTALADYLLSGAQAGLTADTRTEVARLLAENPGEQATTEAVFALLLAGDTARARTVGAALWARPARAPSVTRIVRPAFEGLDAIRAGRPAEAIEILKAAEPWEDKFNDAMLSANVRGYAYLALGDGKAAGEQFQRCIDLRGLDALGVAWVRAHLNLGRARALAGDAAGARKAYEEFFALWKNADSDIPVLRQARAEYGKLR